MERPLCRHCGREPASRPRGLGWYCYYSPVRDLYPPTSKYGRRSEAAQAPAAPLPPLPTQARPGTDWKMALMELRVNAGYQPFHPGDAGMDLS